ncbi:MAG: hypothetical protein ACI8V4_001169 [Ilumatobacter sp.]|jgi:hypothetical protein
MDANQAWLDAEPVLVAAASYLELDRWNSDELA